MMFTFLTTGPGYSHTDVYLNVVQAFQVPTISGVYILAMLILGLHLFHGEWSMLQTFGVRFKSRRWIMGTIVALIIAGGYIAIPVAILTGLLR